VSGPRPLKPKKNLKKLKKFLKTLGFFQLEISDAIRWTKCSWDQVTPETIQPGTDDGELTRFDCT